MKTLVLVLPIALMFALAPATAAQELDGSWEIQSETPRGPQTMMLQLDQDGSVLTGSLTMAMPGRGGGGGERTLEIADGEVEGSSFSFAVTMPMRGNSIAQTFSGTIDGDRIVGTIAGPRGERPFEGRRGGGVG